VLKSLLYRLFKRLVGVFFNIVNLLLMGNLPPFGCVCVVVVEQEKILVVERPEGGLVFPGGFIRWQEHSLETARRECNEETGIQLRVNGLIGCISYPSGRSLRMSSLTMIYYAEMIGGELRGSIEGKPSWQSVEELRKRLQRQQKGILNNYLSYKERLL
jgi:ADP-ribose pyrophosphatase YjhB (NUDIX family)